MNDTIPSALTHEPIIVQIAETTYRGERQYVSADRYKGYKLVIDTRRSNHSVQHGQIWQLSPERIAGTVVFCRPFRLKLTAAGVHPLVEQTKHYVDNHHRVTIVWLGKDRRDQRIEKRLHCLEVIPIYDGTEVVRLTFDDSSTWDLHNYRGQVGSYSRFSGQSFRDGTNYFVTFWEN